MQRYLDSIVCRASGDVESDPGENSRDDRSADRSSHERRIALYYFLSENPADYKAIGEMPVGDAFGYALTKLRQIKEYQAQREADLPGSPMTPDPEEIVYGETKTLEEIAGQQKQSSGLTYQTDQVIPKAR